MTLQQGNGYFRSSKTSQQPWATIKKREFHPKQKRNQTTKTESSYWEKLSLHLYPVQGVDEGSGEIVVGKSLSFIQLLMVLEQVWDWHFCSYQCVFCLFVCSILVWFFLWLSVNLVVFSSLWNWRFLCSYERYFQTAARMW